MTEPGPEHESPANEPQVSDQPVYESIDDAFAAMAMLHAESTALDGPAGRFSYSTLDGIVDSLAAHLDSWGIGAESAVAVLDGPTPGSIAAHLAVLRLGAVVVPVAPSRHATEAATILDDSGAGLLLTGRGVRVPPTTRIPVAVINELLVTEALPQKRHVPGDRTAFITYHAEAGTVLKRSRLPHADLVRSAAEVSGWYGAGPQPRFAHPLLHDAEMALIADIRTLMTGSCLVLPTYDDQNAEARPPVGATG